MRWLEQTGSLRRARQPFFETQAMAPPGLPFAFCCGHDDLARVSIRRFNLVPAEAALPTECYVDQERILSGKAR